MTTPRSVVIFMLDGEADGLRTAQIQMSTILAVAFRRAQLKRAVETFPELSRPGVYVLYGLDPESSDSPTAYIGESQNVAKRLGTHMTDASKDDSKYAYWADTIALVNKDDNLTKAHAMQIERQLIEAAQKNLLWTLKNGKGGHQESGGLPLHDMAACATFVEHGRVLIECLSLDLFRGSLSGASVKTSAAKEFPEQVPEVPVFHYTGNGYKAKMKLSPSDGFVVLEGSLARLEETPSLAESTRKLRSKLVENGMLVKTEDGFRFEADVVFPSISGAAQTVSGTTVNGRSAWKTSEGKTYTEWEAAANAQLETGDEEG